MGLEDQEDEALEDGMTTPPVYLTPSRSLSRLRVDTNRVRNAFAKYKKAKLNSQQVGRLKTYSDLSELSVHASYCGLNLLLSFNI